MFNVKNFPRKKLSWWLKHESDIDFESDFQRTDRVWKSTEQAFLIDSILNNFEIPRIYLIDFSRHDIPAMNRRRKRFAVIDGKQRLTAMLAFLHGRTKLARQFHIESDPQLKLGGLRIDDLKAQEPRVARKISDFAPEVRIIESDDRARVQDFFLRLNKASKALNGAELRNAFIEEAVDSIRLLAKHPFFRQKIRFDTGRSQEKNAAAKILLLEYESGPAETKKKNLDGFVRRPGLANTGRFKKAVKRVNRYLNMMCRVFQDQDFLLDAQGHVPLYYLFLTRLRAADRAKVRGFIVDFEHRRTKYRNQTGGPVDAALSRYDLASRTTNDRNSINTRLQIIRKKYASWRN
jgi:hypothetical protein